jgi:hypothetical protein
MRLNDRLTTPDEAVAPVSSQRFIGGLLHGLAFGVATLLAPRDPRQGGDMVTEPFVPFAHEIGARSAWGVGG